MRRGGPHAAMTANSSLAPGDKVAAGEVLVELECEALRLSRVAAQARLEEATRRRDAAHGEKRLAARSSRAPKPRGGEPGPAA